VSGDENSRHRSDDYRLPGRAQSSARSIDRGIAGVSPRMENTLERLSERVVAGDPKWDYYSSQEDILYGDTGRPFPPASTPSLPAMPLDQSLVAFLDQRNNTSTIDSANFRAAIEASYAEVEKNRTMDGFDYISLYVISGDYVLASVGNGNLGFDLKTNAASRQWASDSQIVVASGSGDSLFYYPDEM
jgi:hypothetical protein